MKKIGILYGMEYEFPEKLVSEISNKKPAGVRAELITTGAINISQPTEYSVILDRVSHEVPFYRSYLKHSVLNGAKVINNPFWNAFDNNFFQNSMALKTGLNVPRTVVLPTKEHPYGTSSDTMRNLIFPLNWDEVFEYIGFPAIIRPNKEHAGRSEFIVYNTEEFFAAYDLTGSIVMILQEYIDFDRNYFCYTIGSKNVKVMNYDPRKPYHLRFPNLPGHIDPELEVKLEKICLDVSKTLGLEFNAVEIGIKDNTAYIKDFYNPAPNSDSKYIKEDNFNWLIERTAEFLIEEALKPRDKIKKYSPEGLLFSFEKKVSSKAGSSSGKKIAAKSKKP